MNQKSYIVFIILIVLFASCKKDFLEVNNTQELFRESYVKDLTSMQEYVNGIYYRLSLYLEAGELEATYSELVADNIRPYSTTSSPISELNYNWGQSSLGGRNMNRLWRNSYMAIRNCSFVIEDVDKYRKENSAKAEDIKGQALAIRALLYFKLINVFAQPYRFTAEASHPGVPYITTSDITKSYGRQTVAQGYDGMINDLTSAIQLLPTVTADTRIMSRNAAKALLSRIYLFKEDYVNAKKLALEIANQIPLMTTIKGYPENLFSFKPSNSTEVLFQLYPPEYNSLGYLLRPEIFDPSFPPNPPKYVATNDVAALLRNNPDDVRSKWVIEGMDDSGNPIWLIQKFPVGVAPEADPQPFLPEDAYYTPIVRSSEMFLTVAEAAAKTNDESTARLYLNAIRKRADGSINDITASGQALLDSIHKERRKELAFESLRMFDLLRLKMGVNRIDVLPGTSSSLPFPNDKAISPIPQQEVRLSGIPQNPSY